MSRNFELMQAALRQTDLDQPSLHRAATIAFPSVTPQRARARLGADFDATARDECLKLVQRLFLNQPTDASRVVVFSAVNPGDGCSRICAETALMLAANTSSSICLVDANFRDPSLARFFSLLDYRGLVDAVAEEGDVRDFATPLNPPNLWLLSAGSIDTSSPSLLNSDRLKTRIQELRQEFDYVLIDVPCLNLYTDAIAIGRVTDGVVVVLQAESTRRDSALKNINTLRDAQVPVLGAVLNRRTFPIPGFVYCRL